MIRHFIRGIIGIPILLSCYLSSSQVNSTIFVANTTSEIVNAYGMDIDGDGDDDIIATNGTDNIPFYEFHSTHPSKASSFHIYQNNGELTFTDHELATINTIEKFPFAFGDVNNDNLADYLRYESGVISYWPQETNLTFPTGQTIIDLNPLFMLVEPELGCALAQEFLFDVERIQVGDINQDNLNDIIFICATRLSVNDPVTCGEDHCYALINEGSGFSSPVYLFTAMLDLVNELGQSAFFSELQVEDINGDGYNDIWYARHEGQYMDFYLHAGVSAGIDPNPHFMSDVGYYAAFGDTNNDGDNDIALIDPYNNLINSYDGLNPGVPLYLNYESESPVAAGFIMSDLNLDGNSEFITVKADGDATFQFITGDDSYMMQYEEYSYDSDILGSVIQFSALSAANSTAQDILCMTQSGIYILTTTPETTTVCAIQITPFLDINLNGDFDSGELQPVIPPVLVEQANLAYFMNVLSFETGLNLPEGEITATYVDDDVYTNPLFSSPLTYQCAAGSPIEILLPFEIQGNPQSHIDTDMLHWNVICGDPINVSGHYIYLINDGTADLSCDVIFTLDGHTNFISAIPTPDVVNGNELRWANMDLAIGEYATMIIYNTPYSANDVNETATYEAEFQITSAIGGNYTQTYQGSEIIQCSYDPNLIEEKTGYTAEGYFSDGQILDYTIYFQNTGNATAENVTIENVLSTDFNVSSIELINASHPMYYSVSSNAINFYFDNIQLPDSSTDYVASMGFVTYRIAPQTGLEHGHIVENNAQIYFDFNEAIVTNTETNTKYHCTDLENVSDFVQSYCSEEDEIIVSNTAQWIEEIQWSYNSENINNANAQFQCGEGGNLLLNVSNALCSYSQMWQIENQAPAVPVMTASGNQLNTEATGTLQWYYNGDPIADANQSSYEITESGNYSIGVTNEFGCSSISEEQIIIYESVAENGKHNWMLYPIPTDGIITMNTSQSGYMQIADITGRILMKQFMTSGLSEIDVRFLPAGNYLIHFNGTNRIIQIK